MKRISYLLCAWIFSLFIIPTAHAQVPVNDDCGNAIPVPITGGGFDLGTFNSPVTELANATLQTGETFATAIFIAGLNQKSVWYKFTLPTTRKVTVYLYQTGTAINAGDVGFTVYKGNNCTPVNVSQKLTPLGYFGSTSHSCTDSSEYLVQVSSKLTTTGQIYISVKTEFSLAPYDFPSTSYNFGTLSQGTSTKIYDVECQSLENDQEICPILANYQAYTKSTWHVFKTPNYMDYLSLVLTKSAYGTTKVGYKIYEGDVTSSSYTNLPVAVSCDSMLLLDNISSRKSFLCGALQPNKTYSLQLFFRYDFIDQIKVTLAVGGITPTQSPQPILSSMPAGTNNLGVLPSDINGINSFTSDYFGCNSRHAVTACGPSISTPGVYYAPTNSTFNLSTFFTFTISHTSNFYFSATSGYCNSQYYARLYNQAPTNSCNSLDTANIIGLSPSGSGFFSCLPPGNYTLQVMGREIENSSSGYYWGSFSDGITTGSPCYFGDLGSKVNLQLNVKRLPENKFSLSAPGAFDTINRVGGVMMPLTLNTQYVSQVDSFGCANTVLPWDTTCTTTNTKVIYREFLVADTGVLYYSNNTWNKIYKGDANALAQAQNVFNYPQKIQNLQTYTECRNSYECENIKVCMVPGTYTHASFGDVSLIGQPNQTSYTLKATESAYGNPSNAENMGDIFSQVNPVSGGTVFSNIDYFSCRDNAVPIAGLQPCTLYNDTATKVIYRQFYLSTPVRLVINNEFYYPSCNNYVNEGSFTVFAGKASDGLNTLTAMSPAYQCQTYIVPGLCDVFEPGWYTIASYGSGPSYTNPLKNLNEGNRYSSSVGRPNRITLTMTPACPGPKYNRPVKAAIDTITNQPFLLQWGPKGGHTPAYPKTDTTYVLYKENFNCTVDTPFNLHPVPACSTGFTKVAYWVFQTTQESYVEINTMNYYGAVYSGNARNGTATFDSSTQIQKCMASMGKIQICKLQPGTYTLVIFADNSNNCVSVTPSIYIDRVGYSRFDHANKAYDFGAIPDDSAWHNGKPGDINPLDPTRAPSNDFIYCTTGSQPNDPTGHSCYTEYISKIYDPNPNVALYSNFNSISNFIMPRRNLWYSFTIKKGGTVRVKVDPKTPGKLNNYRFGIYKSNVDGTLPLSTLAASGQIDSTNQELTQIAVSPTYFYCMTGGNELTFYRDPCSPIEERYYIVVENPNTYAITPDFSGLKPNSQLEVSVLFDSVNAIMPLFDHYATAGVIGTNLAAGTFTGPTDNFSCATSHPQEPNFNYSPSCTKSLWYKFSVSITGKLRYRIMINGLMWTNGTWPENVQLFRELIPGDSTQAGLQLLPSYSMYYDGNGQAWVETCARPGTYYMRLPGCYRINEYVYPQIMLTEEKGDFCSAPMVANLAGPGSNITSLIVDCHTIGTDYGEYNNTLTCPQGAPRNNYKTSWFRLDVTGTDTLDVTTYITENTSATSSQIKYRMMDGNCGAMQERSCVQDALTQDTYKCLIPGRSYYFQVFSPASATGTISLNLSAVVHADTCATEKNCLSTAVFIPEFDCTLNDSVRFTNVSTYGAGISYEWNFGYNNQTSTAASPVFAYPVLATSQSYTVTLKVTNTGCTPGSQNVDSVSQTITMPGRPKVNLGNDTTICTYGQSLSLDATTWPGSTYQWSNGSTASSVSAYSPWVNTYSVTVTYNGCIKRDTIVVAINGTWSGKLTRYICDENPVQFNSHRGAGETHSWNTGSNLYYLNASNAGLYTNQINWRGCSMVDSFTLIKAPEPFASRDTTICNPFQSFTLSANTPGSLSWIWSNGSGSSSIPITNPGTYSVMIYHGNCYKKDTINVLAAPNLINLFANESICSGSQFILPWGAVANSTGIYSDTIRYASGCDSLIRKVNLAVTDVNNVVLNPNICAGQNYILPWGTIVNTGGNYRDTVRTISGCDSIIRSVNLSINMVTNSVTNETICSSNSYILPWGQVVTAAGSYSDTLDYVAGCDSIIRKVNLTVLTTTITTNSASICSGQTYTLPWGTTATTSGLYSDTLHYQNGCDSIIRHVNLNVDPPLSQNINASICQGSAYVLPWGTTVNSTGIYYDTTKYISGCDSLVSSVNLVVKPLLTSVLNASICNGSSYILPSGNSVSSTGIYIDTLHYISGCDSLIRTVNLQVYTTSYVNTAVSICSGQNYTTDWGAVINTTGIYSDTLHFANGCDSLIRTVNLNVNPPASQNINASICGGTSYILPWGPAVSASGIYSDTLHYVSGCDSLVTTVNLLVKPLLTNTINASICAGSLYTLPSGNMVSSAGIYTDTIHYLSGCDSLIRTVNLSLQSPIEFSQTVNICTGSSYTLPWGQIVNSSGIYKDTISYALTGCDSLRQSFSINVLEPQTIHSSPVICQGASFTLPWGQTVTAAGMYKDTLYYISGCDSVIREVNLSIRTLSVENSMVTVCSGQSFILPWGASATTTGVYSDTLEYASGCDSLIRNYSVTVLSSAIMNSTSAAICTGQSYSLPWGTVITASGLYSDTLHNLNGCDSVITTVNLSVNAPVTQSINASICSGTTYTLPWGTLVSVAGIYTDTLYYLNGCDSLYQSVNLQVLTSTTQNTSATICAGQNYTLPWGVIVNSSGLYSDTMYYTTGCDSLITNISLQVRTLTVNNSNATICSGSAFTLPWGGTVTTSGIYSDTLFYPDGCDSLVTSVALTVQQPLQSITTHTICEGNSFTLPWGITVSSAGIYRDTIRYVNGCDSLVSAATIIIQAKSFTSTSVTICQGQSHLLPWGTLVSSTGIYRDTLHYAAGCDSIIREVNVEVKPVIIQNVNATTCSGIPYVLPWGTIVNSSGIYTNTITYSNGCDSLKQTVNLNVTAPATTNASFEICSNEVFTLPWGPVVNTSGIYRDTVKTTFGCDSLINIVQLTVHPEPMISLSKSNDITCALGTANLLATGGVQYEWSPAASLTNSFISNPVASPTTSTMYHVKVTTANECTAEDSILIDVNLGSAAEGYYVASAFTPNGDGKNDCFGVKTWGAVTDLKFSIFNRWGELVFSTTNTQHCWDGTYKTAPQRSEVFVYVISANTICGPVLRKGTVTLIR